MRRSDTRSRRLVVAAAAIVAAGVVAAVAYAGYIYLPAGYHTSADVGNSTYSTSWSSSTNYSPDCCFDKQVTLIDNVTYSWHGTARNTNNSTIANWYEPSIGKKGHCQHFMGGYSACSVAP